METKTKFYKQQQLWYRKRLIRIKQELQTNLLGQPKASKMVCYFQAQGLDGRAMLEASKKLSAYALIKTNTTDTLHSRRVMQHNPHIKEKL